MLITYFFTYINFYIICMAHGLSIRKVIMDSQFVLTLWKDNIGIVNLVLGAKKNDRYTKQFP